MKACSISLLITFFRFRTGRLAGGCSGNTVGRQQIDSRCYAKFALDPCCQRVDKLSATFFIADPTLDLQNDFFLGGNKSNRIARMNFRFLFRYIFNILRPDITATNNNQIFNASYSAAIFLIPICISFDTAEKRRYATYLILNRRFSFAF